MPLVNMPKHLISAWRWLEETFPEHQDVFDRTIVIGTNRIRALKYIDYINEVAPLIDEAYLKQGASNFPHEYFSETYVLPLDAGLGTLSFSVPAREDFANPAAGTLLGLEKPLHFIFFNSDDSQIADKGDEANDHMACIALFHEAAHHIKDDAARTDTINKSKLSFAVSHYAAKAFAVYPVDDDNASALNRHAAELFSDSFAVLAHSVYAGQQVAYHPRMAAFRTMELNEQIETINDLASILGLHPDGFNETVIEAEKIIEQASNTQAYDNHPLAAHFTTAAFYTPELRRPIKTAQEIIGRAAAIADKYALTTLERAYLVVTLAGSEMADHTPRAIKKKLAPHLAAHRRPII